MEKVFVKYKYRGLIFRIYKELKFNNQENNLVSKGGMELHRDGTTLRVLKAEALMAENIFRNGQHP